MTFKKDKKLNSFAGTGLKVMILRFLSIGLQFLTLFLITNNASEELVGKYNYLNSTIVIISTLCLMGMNNSILQFSGKLDAENNIGYLKEIYKKKILLLIISSISVLIIYFILSKGLRINYFRDNELNRVILKVLLLLFPYALTQFNYQVIRGLGFLFLSEIFRNVIRFGGFFLMILFLTLTNQLEWLLNAFILIFLILATFSTIIIVIKLHKLSLSNKSTKITYKRILKVSLPMSISFISLQIMQGIDVLFLEQYADFATVGHYGVAVKISTVVGIVLMSVNSIVAPKVSSLYFQNKTSELKSLISKASFFTFIFTTPIILLIFLFSGFILTQFGENYILAQSALVIILVGQVVNSFCGSVGVYLNMTGKQVLFQNILLSALVVNILLNAILIPQYGMLGAAISTSICTSLWNVIGGIIIYKKDTVNIFASNLLTSKLSSK